jgi:hypothetical protein
VRRTVADVVSIVLIALFLVLVVAYARVAPRL